MNIYIGNLSLETTEEDLRVEFLKFGEVTSVTIMNDQYIGSGQPRAYGYVQMISKEQGTAAIATGTLLSALHVTGTALKDHRIAVFADCAESFEQLQKRAGY